MLQDLPRIAQVALLAKDRGAKSMRVNNEQPSRRVLAGIAAIRKRIIQYNYNHTTHTCQVRPRTSTGNRLARVHRLALRPPRGRDVRDVLLDDERADLFLLDLCRPPTELVGALLDRALVGLDEVAEHLRVRRGDHARVDVGAGAQVVEDTRGDRGADEIKGFCTLLRDGDEGNAEKI